MTSTSYKIICFIIFTYTIFPKINAEKGCPPQEAILPCRCLIRGNEYQIWCSHSSLSSVLEGLKSIGKFLTSPIDELILENNYLPSLPGRTFTSLKILRLMLRQNALERVSTDWLAGLESSLMELFIVEPKLNSLPQLSIAHLKNLKAVTLRSKLLKRLPMFSGLPHLRYVQIEADSLTELSPTNFKENPSLERLHIQFSSRLTRLEANQFDDLPKLELINITDCGLNWVHPRAFSRLPNLKELSLIGNKITDAGMVGRSSREMPDLEILRLDYNYIGTLDEGTFVDMPALKKIYLSNNVIGEIKKGALHRLQSLQSLDLSRNMLRRIQMQSFLQPVALEELNLKDNDINDVIQIRYILEDLPKLIYLDLSYNKLDSIPFGSLMGHSTLEQLNLGYNRLQNVDKEAFIAMPALRELTLTNNSIPEGLRVPFWNLPALKGLDLSRNYLRRLELGFLGNVGALRRADLSKNYLDFVDPEAFLQTPFLEHINISSNNLKMLHPATFRHLAQLYELDVSQNNLKVLVPGLPGNIEHLYLRQNEISKMSAVDLQLPALRLLDLSENRIQTLNNGEFRSLGHLKRLYLRSNFLRHLSEDSLEGLVQLEILDLSNNRISEINPISMKSIVELRILDIANNQLSLLGPAMLSNSKNLKKFNASYNRLGELLPNTFDANTMLEDIDLSSNLLVQFTESLYGLEKLKKLDLSRNRLKNLNATILSSLTHLKEIKLSKNFIQILEANTFGQLRHLTTIFLDDNDIMLMESNSIKMLPTLKLLKIDKNQIKELPSKCFNTLLSLQIVELQENNIKFIDPQAFHLVPQILTLNLSHNEIFKAEDAGLKSLKSLELLDMSFNKISRMSPNFNQLEWLVELRLKNNFICEVDEGVFGNMPRLKVLDLRNNKLVSFPEVAVERLRENTAQLDVIGNPLDCSCDMLWLKSWLRESSQSGPRCSDGGLLREMPLSSRDCPADRQKDKPFTGCDTEFLNSPDFENSVVSSKYSSLRNFTFNGKNNLAPNPQESEYFYDDYIDYPFNSSIVDPNGYLNEKINDKNGVLERIPVAMKHFSGNITGNTPTLYAAPSKKKPKPSIPPKVPDSPSTSGFTFFGIPLPPLGLNNFFAKKEDHAVPQTHAERKNAILNKSRKDKRQPTPKIADRVHPIFTPELQGGFTPILPGYGGFKPIPDPRLQFTSTIPSTTVTQKPVGANLDKPNNKKLLEDKIEHFVEENPVESNLKQKKFNLELVSNKSSLIISADSSSAINNRNKKNQLTEEDVSHKINTTKLESKANIQYFNKSEVHYIEEYPANITSEITEQPILRQQTSTFKSTLPTAQTTLSPEPTSKTTLMPKQDTKKPMVSTISTPLVHQNEKEIVAVETQIKNSEDKMLTTTTNRPKITTEENKIEFKELKNHSGGFPLSDLQIPSGQQPFFKPTAKSTITKVASPHGSASAPLLSSLEVSDLDDFPIAPQKVVSEEIITSTEDTTKNDWYFENYNKRNLEPFVAKIVHENSGSMTERGGLKMVMGLLSLFLLVYC